MANSIFGNLDNLSLQDLEADAELIPLMTSEDEEHLQNEALPNSLPLLPLRNTVLFPGVVIPITAGRDKSIQLIKDANKGDKVIGVVAQKDDSVENPEAKDIYNLGTVARILRVLKMPDGSTTVIIQGKKRFAVNEIVSETPYLKATISEVEKAVEDINGKEFQAIIEEIKELALKIIQENPNIPSEASFAIKNIQSPSFLVNFVASNLNLPVKEKQDLLALKSLHERAMKCLQHMDAEYQKLLLKNDIQTRVRNDLDQNNGSTTCTSSLKPYRKNWEGYPMKKKLKKCVNGPKPCFGIKELLHISTKSWGVCSVWTPKWQNIPYSGIIWTSC